MFSLFPVIKFGKTETIEKKTYSHTVEKDLNSIILIFCSAWNKQFFWFKNDGFYSRSRLMWSLIMLFFGIPMSSIKQSHKSLFMNYVELPIVIIWLMSSIQESPKSLFMYSVDLPIVIIRLMSSIQQSPKSIFTYSVVLLLWFG